MLDTFTGGNRVACDLSLLRPLERVSRREGDLETLNPILQRKATLLSGARAKVMLTIVNGRLLICDDLDDPRDCAFRRRRTPFPLQAEPVPVKPNTSGANLCQRLPREAHEATVVPLAA